MNFFNKTPLQSTKSYIFVSLLFLIALPQWENIVSLTSEQLVSLFPCLCLKAPNYSPLHERWPTTSTTERVPNDGENFNQQNTAPEASGLGRQAKAPGRKPHGAPKTRSRAFDVECFHWLPIGVESLYWKSTIYKAKCKKKHVQWNKPKNLSICFFHPNCSCTFQAIF